MLYPQLLASESELHFFQDKALDFYAIICLQKNGRGPALGGCRMMAYSSLDAAMQEAMRLAKAMSHKAILSGLPHDGGKAVIIQSDKPQDRAKVLKKFAECVHSLGGKYITTIDSGTSQADMSLIKNHTPYVTGCFDEEEENNPSYYTALGVFEGIKAAVKIIHHHENLAGMHVALQGVGNVGYLLAKFLHAAGASLTVCDIDQRLVQRCVAEFNANVATPSAIYNVDCDIFAPCALGQILNPHTVPQLKAYIIAGAANDQLQSCSIADALAARNILYIPDYVINAGGLIHLSLQRDNKPKTVIRQDVMRIHERILHLAEQARVQNKTLFAVAEAVAEGGS